VASSPDELRPDVLVVGAGAIGVAAAHALAERGVGVVVVEARDAPGAECSYGNAGLISPSHCIPLAAPGLLGRVPGWLRPGGAVYVKPRLSLSLARFGIELLRSCNQNRMIAGLRTLRDLARASRDSFEQHVRDGLEFGYRRDGLMNVCVSERALQALLEDAELLRREGLEPEVLGPSEARRREPALRADISGGVFWAEDAHCEPGRFVTELARAAERRGVHFELGLRVTGLDGAPGGAIAAVRTERGTFRPRKVVLAAGAWTPELARMAGLRIPLEAAKGYHVELRDGAPQLRMPLIFQESVFAATPMGGALRLAGTMEFVGLDPELSPPRALRLLDEARLYLDGLNGSGPRKIWCGFRPCTPDSLPIVGQSGRVPNLLLATGHAMLGLTLAPATGRALADLALDGRCNLPIEPLSPARYRL
jgi:D-amino-acid dehydrogenase